MVDKTIKEEISFSSYFRVLKENIAILTIILIVGLAASIGYAFFIGSTFQATATIQSPDEGQSGGSAFGNMIQSFGSFGGGGSGQGKLQLFSEYLKSRENGKYIADSLNLISHPFFKNLEGNNLYNVVASMLDINITRTNILRITVNIQTPPLPSDQEKATAAQLAADVANKAIDGLNWLIHEKSTSKAKKKRIFIEKILEQKKADLDSVDKVIEAFQRSNKLVGLDKQAQSTVSSAIGVGAELAKTEIDLNTKLIEYDDNSPIISAYKKRIADLKGQFNRAQSGGIIAGDRYSVPLEQLPLLVRQYTNMIRDQKVLEQVTVYLETQRYQEAIQEQNDYSSVEPIDRAIVSPEKTGPPRKLIITLGFLISLLVITDFCNNQGNC